MLKPREKSRGLFTYLILYVIVLGTAINTGLNLLFFISIIMLFTMVFTYLIGRGNISKITTERKMKKEIYEDSIIEYEYIVRSERNSYYYHIKESFPDYIEAPPVLLINHSAGGKELIVKNSIKFTIPGVFYLNDINILSHYPAAFLSFEKTLNSYNEVLVFPKKIDFTYFPEEILENSSNSEISTRVGTGDNIWGLKPFNRGDRLKDIDWKKSLKYDEIMVKVREHPQGKRIWVIPFLKNNKKDQNNADIIRLSASIATDRLKNDAAVGGIFGPDIILPGGSNTHQFVILKKLIGIWDANFDHSIFKNTGLMEREDTVFIITNRDTRYFIHIVENMKKHNLRVIFIYTEQSEINNVELLRHAIENEYTIFIVNRKDLSRAFDHVHS